MNRNRKRLVFTLVLSMLLVLAFSVPALAAEEGAEQASRLYGTFWSLIPPVIAIVLALITKEA